MFSSFQASSSPSWTSPSNRRRGVARILLWSAALFALVGLATPSAQAQGDVDFAALAAVMSPGEHHQAMAEEAGEFHYQSKVWMIPGQPPAVTRGDCVREMILDGRYLREELSGEVMGQPFRGVGISGFDNATGKYRSIWIDTLGTGILNFVGEASSEDGSEVTYRGEGFNPVTQSAEAVRSIYTTVSADEQHFHYYVTPPGGEERLQMTVVYWRKGTEEPKATQSEPVAE